MAAPAEDPSVQSPPSTVNAQAPGGDLRRSERSMVLVRWMAVGFSTLQVLAYEDRPYPEHVPVFALALVAVGLLAAGTIAGQAALARVTSERGMRRLALLTLGLDGAIAMAFAWLWAFDPDSALWAVLFIIPLEGAIKFQLKGALLTWAGIVAFYTGREFWAAATYPDPQVQWNSITFRMGIGLLIALVAGLMARNLTRQKALVEEALGQLRRIDALRTGLISTLAHDVRNPLTAIRGTLRVLLRQGEKVDAELAEELLTTADRQAGRLERLAADLLDLARLERGRLELNLERVNLAEVVRQASTYVAGSEEFGIEVQDNLEIRADPGRVEQIVVNLTANALRYGRPPFTIESETRDGEVILSFRDHGPGVPEDERQELFQPFRSEPDASSVGFGLAIVKALAEAHGGTAFYEDNQPGARFGVRLPLEGPRDREPDPD